MALIIAFTLIAILSIVITLKILLSGVDLTDSEDSK
jgi:hypothetical protein